MVTYNKPPDNTRTLAIAAAVVVTFLVGCLFIPGLNPLTWIRSIGSCTIGVTGYAATITFSGPNAQDDCNAYLNQYSGTYYNMTEQPTGTELCEGDLVAGDTYQGPNGLEPAHYTVRDTGMLDLIGNQFCKDLQPVADSTLIR